MALSVAAGSGLASSLTAGVVSSLVEDSSLVSVEGVVADSTVLSSAASFFSSEPSSLMAGSAEAVGFASSVSFVSDSAQILGTPMPCFLLYSITSSGTTLFSSLAPSQFKKATRKLSFMGWMVSPSFFITASRPPAWRLLTSTPSCRIPLAANASSSKPAERVPPRLPAFFVLDFSFLPFLEADLSGFLLRFLPSSKSLMMFSNSAGK